MKLVFYSNVNRSHVIYEKSYDTYVSFNIPRIGEHIYLCNKEYKVDGIVRNYDLNCIELYLQPLNKNYATYKS